MDAVEFLDKVDRLSKKGTPEEKMCYNNYRTAEDNTWAVAFVEQWDKEHPVKTRQSELLRIFPNAKVLMDVSPICPRLVDRNYATIEDCDSADCKQCRKEFWLAEVEE